MIILDIIGWIFIVAGVIVIGGSIVEGEPEAFPWGLFGAIIGYILICL